ncbi:hypothetical protein [Pseudomonas rhizosphaerae]|uniref:hypothetical protein n=1 Tax=Pseudomonas rhizosphaerae TaxID=216142 RepID=UPI002B47C725|nr:hypothetical protein [Pseudomonas rhizosphaerae]MEB2869417.1 hypothetical protein [Pseudomonas rhizosphaerae]
MADEKGPDSFPEHVSKFLDGPVDYSALTQVIGPLRSAVGVLTSVTLDMLLAMKAMPLEGEAKERADSAWNKFREVFDALEQIDSRTGRIYDGRYPWNVSGDPTDE